MKLSVNVTGTEAVRRQLLQIGQQAGAKALAATAEALEDYVGQEAGKHTKTGALFRSVRLRPIPGGYVLDHDLQVAKHALFVHWGTRPHVIRPKNKRALRWAGGGVFKFAGKVNHPGNKADPWLTRAARMAPAIFERQVAAHLARIQQQG